MSDILSQNQIDELLSALSTGEMDVTQIEDTKKEKKVRKYDFTRPDKFAKDQLKTLEIIHENFGRLINNFLSGFLRSMVEVEVTSTESVIYNEFTNSISNPALLGVVDFYPLDGQIIIEMSVDLAFSMIDRVLGGIGVPMNTKDLRPMTEIELTLVRKILTKFINLLKEPWSNIIELEPKLETIETNSQFAQIVSPTESIALITLSLKVGDADGLINICLPHMVIEPILSQLSSKLWFTSTGKKELNEDETNALVSEISKSKIDMTTIIGRTNVSIEELLSLRNGDVIVLDKSVKAPLDIFIGRELKFHGVPGTRKNKVAVKITETLE